MKANKTLTIGLLTASLISLAACNNPQKRCDPNVMVCPNGPTGAPGTSSYVPMPIPYGGSYSGSTTTVPPTIQAVPTARAPISAPTTTSRGGFGGTAAGEGAGG